MKLLRITAKGLPLFKETLTIDFFAQQRVDSSKNDTLYKLFSFGTTSIYLNNAISFVGINASGKTTTLKVIAFIIEMLNYQSINNCPHNKILEDLQEEETVTFETYFYCRNHTLNKLKTTIKKCYDDQKLEKKYIIDDEKAWSKSIEKIKTKKNMFEFDEKDFILERDKDADFLLEDVSIAMAILKKNKDCKMFYLDLMELTNHTWLRIQGDYPAELIEFLDPSVEYVRFTKDNEGNLSTSKESIRLKFKDRDEIILRDPRELSHYLSSGTIKGINIFMNAICTFLTSGYLIIDELENHFNKEIVATLIRFFMDSKVNENGGTLIFSTHYVELLDEFDRNDCIYIVRNRDGISTQNLSSILKRNDIKKSEAYESGFLEGTVPMYDAYINLKTRICKFRGEQIEWRIR